MNELVNGIISPVTRARLLAVVDRLKQQHRIDGLILGGTELPLILGDLTGSPHPFSGHSADPRPGCSGAAVDVNVCQSRIRRNPLKSKSFGRGISFRSEVETLDLGG